jgi:sec-independent protein translocase protein TatB
MFFNIGGAEVLVIAMVALIAVGPEQLPSVLRKFGRRVSQLRSMTSGLRDEFMAGLDDANEAVNPNSWLKGSGRPNDPIVPRGLSERGNGDSSSASLTSSTGDPEDEPDSAIGKTSRRTTPTGAAARAAGPIGSAAKRREASKQPTRSSDPPLKRTPPGDASPAGAPAPAELGPTDGAPVERARTDPAPAERAPTDPAPARPGAGGASRPAAPATGSRAAAGMTPGDASAAGETAGGAGDDEDGEDRS